MAERTARRSKATPPGRVKIRLASKDGVYVVEVEGPSDEATDLADSASRLWTALMSDAGRIKKPEADA